MSQYVKSDNLIIMFMMYLGIVFISFYSARLTFYSMNMNCNFYKLESLSEKINYMSGSTIIVLLTLYSIISGSMFSWLMFIESNLIILSIKAKLMTLIFHKSNLIGVWNSHILLN